MDLSQDSQLSKVVKLRVVYFLSSISLKLITRRTIPLTEFHRMVVENMDQESKPTSYLSFLQRPSILIMDLIKLSRICNTTMKLWLLRPLEKSHCTLSLSLNSRMMLNVINKEIDMLETFLKILMTSAISTMDLVSLSLSYAVSSLFWEHSFSSR